LTCHKALEEWNNEEVNEEEDVEQEQQHFVDG